MKILVLDTRPHQNTTPVDVARRQGAQVVRATHVPDDDFHELVTMDYGDAASLRAVDEALRYRAGHPRCQVSVVRVLDRLWTDTECRARVYAEPPLDGDWRVKLSDLPRVMANEPRARLHIDNDAVLFEYAA